MGRGLLLQLYAFQMAQTQLHLPYELSPPIFWMPHLIEMAAW